MITINITLVHEAHRSGSRDFQDGGKTKFAQKRNFENVKEMIAERVMHNILCPICSNTMYIATI